MTPPDELISALGELISAIVTKGPTEESLAQSAKSAVAEDNSELMQKLRQLEQVKAEMDRRPQ